MALLFIFFFPGIHTLYIILEELLLKKKSNTSFFYTHLTNTVYNKIINVFFFPFNKIKNKKKKVRNTLGSVDVLVLNQGYTSHGAGFVNIEDLPTALFDQAHHTQCRGSFLCVKQVLRPMRENGESNKKTKLQQQHKKIKMKKE